MHSYIEVSKFIQDDKTLNKVATFIMSTELSSKILTSEFKLDGVDFRLISTNHGSVTLEYFTTYCFKVDGSSISNESSFFKPIGFFYFDKPLVIAFTVLKEFEIISLKQDELFSKPEKRIKVYRNSQILWDTIVACFSAEVKIALDTYFEFMDSSKISKVATPDSVFLTWTFNKIIKANGLDLQFLTTHDLTMIQIHLHNNEEVKYPVAAYTGKGQIQILPFLKEKFDKVEPLKLFTAERV